MTRFKTLAFLVLILPSLVFAGVTSDTPDVARGAILFQRCVSCHAADGGGVNAGTTPRIAGQHYRVLLRQLADFRRGDRPDFRMGEAARKHAFLPTGQDVADVAGYVSALSHVGDRGIGNGQYVERGSLLYAALCANCHGASGEGDDGKVIPRLAGQHEGYLVRQIYDAAEGRRPPLSTHRKRFSHLSFEDVLGIADFLARIGREEGTTPAEPTADEPHGR